MHLLRSKLSVVGVVAQRGHAQVANCETFRWVDTKLIFYSCFLPDINIVHYKKLKKKTYNKILGQGMYTL